MKKKYWIISVVVLVMLLCGICILWYLQDKTPTIPDNSTQNGTNVTDETQKDDEEQTTELPIIVPSEDDEDKPNDGTENADNKQEEVDKTDEDDITEDSGNKTTELPFVPAQ